MKSLSLITVMMLLLTGFIVSTAQAEEKGDAAAGKAKYDQFCATCHGPEGKGDGPGAAALDPKPRDLSNAEFTSTISNEHIYKVIREGGPSVGLSATMPPWGSALSEAETWDIIAYIRQDVCKCKYEKK